VPEGWEQRRQDVALQRSIKLLVLDAYLVEFVQKDKEPLHAKESSFGIEFNCNLRNEQFSKPGHDAVHREILIFFNELE